MTGSQQHVFTTVRPDRESALRFMQAFLGHVDEYGLWPRSDGLLLHWELFAISEGEQDGPQTVVIRQRRQPGA